MLLTRFRRNHHLGFALGLLALGLAPQAAIGSDTPEKILASSLIGALICAVAMATSDPARHAPRHPAAADRAPRALGRPATAERALCTLRRPVPAERAPPRRDP